MPPPLAPASIALLDSTSLTWSEPPFAHVYLATPSNLVVFLASISVVHFSFSIELTQSKTIMLTLVEFEELSLLTPIQLEELSLLTLVELEELSDLNLN